MEKRSLSIAGHRTSIALEAEFWATLEAMAAEQDSSVLALIKSIDENRQITNLASALRIACLDWARRQPVVKTP